MSIPITLWQRCAGAMQSLLFPRFWLAVIEQEQMRVVFSSDNREVTVDGTGRNVRQGEKLLATFDAIQSIDVVHHPRADDGSKPEHWSLSLYLGRSTRAYVAARASGPRSTTPRSCWPRSPANPCARSKP